MKKIFVDTNILVDLIAERQPHAKFAIDLFEKAESKKTKLYTSSHSIATTHYLLKKYIEEKKLRKIILDLLDYVQPIAIDETVLRRGLKSVHKDFEDGIQIIAASTVADLDFIVTRNIKDFKTSEIPALPPNEAVMLIS